MALASFKAAKSVVGLSESPVYHYQYSSISEAVSKLARTSGERDERRNSLQKLFLARFKFKRIIDWQSDGVSLFREHSKCLKDVQFVYKANTVIRGNKPIGIGYPLLFINVADFENRWSLPFEVEIVGKETDYVSLAGRKMVELCGREEFKQLLNINTADTSFGCPKYLSPTSKVKNLVSITRLRHGRKVCFAERKETGGAPQIYGEDWYLREVSGDWTMKKKEQTITKYQASIYENEVDEQTEIFTKTRKGRELRIEIRRWNEMMMHSADGFSMKEAEFDLVSFRVLDEKTGKRVFTEDVFVSVMGLERKRLNLKEVYQRFLRRFDLEVTNRFLKQEMFLEDYQTPVKENVENWILTAQTAMWLLYEASDEVENISAKWQQYNEPKIAEGGKRTPSQTRKGAERLFLSFEKEVYLPKKSEKGMGRKKGTKLGKREEYEVEKKEKVVKRRKRKGEQQE
jgi:hypothetical protein